MMQSERGLEVRIYGKRATMPPLATFLKEELDRQGITQSELERRTGIPDSTLSLILNGKTEEPRGSQIAKIGKALGIPFWRLMIIAKITDQVPSDPDEHALALAQAILARPELASIFQRAEHFSPESRKALEEYAIFLESRKSPPIPPEDR